MPMKQVSISLGEHYISQLNSICVKKDISKSEVIRRALELYMKKEMADEPRAPAQSRLDKQAREEAYERLLKMNDEELTEELDRLELIQINGVNETLNYEFHQRIATITGIGRCVVTITGESGSASDPLDPYLNKIRNNLKKYYPNA